MKAAVGGNSCRCSSIENQTKSTSNATSDDISSFVAGRNPKESHSSQTTEIKP